MSTLNPLPPACPADTPPRHCRQWEEELLSVGGSGFQSLEPIPRRHADPPRIQRRKHQVAGVEPLPEHAHGVRVQQRHGGVPRRAVALLALAQLLRPRPRRAVRVADKERQVAAACRPGAPLAGEGSPR